MNLLFIHCLWRICELIAYSLYTIYLLRPSSIKGLEHDQFGDGAVIFHEHDQFGDGA